MHTILWLIAVILVISGIVTIFRGGLIAGIVLIVVGLLVGPGGSRHDAPSTTARRSRAGTRACRAVALMRTGLLQR